MPRTVRLEEDDWIDQFKPIVHVSTNPDDEAPYNGAFLEGCADDLEKIRAANPACVWTLVESDGARTIIDGFHHVNRIGYFITEKPADPNVSYDILDPDEPAEIETDTP